jgi:hypothetical protein
MTDAEPSPGERGSAEAGGGSDAVPTRPEQSTIGWPRAIATGLAVIVIGFAGAVLGPNAILTKSLALTRSAREWLATALFFAVIAVLAIALRWLQHRKLI